MDLRKKLIYVTGGIILVLILIVVFMYMSKGGNFTKSYEDIEEMLVTNAKKYAQDKPGILPTNNGEWFTLSSTDLSNAGYIKPLQEYVAEGVTCSATITIYNVSGNYDYAPKLECGTAYSTAYLYEELLKDMTTSGAGLYKYMDGEFDLNIPAGTVFTDTNPSARYIYRGENPDNYVMIDDIMFRIVELRGNHDMLLIENETSAKFYKWDDRYNEEIEKEYGINNYEVSRLKEFSETYYADYSDDIKKNFSPMNICIGKRAETESVEKEVECNDTLAGQNITSLTAFQYASASLDEGCEKITDKSCKNYNYLALKDQSWWLLTASKQASYYAYAVNRGDVEVTETRYPQPIRAVVLLGGRARFTSGTGTYDDPYVIN